MNVAKTSLESIGGRDIVINEGDSSTNIKSTVPSIWGWGGMSINVSIENMSDSNVQVITTGYIAQLATSPLTKKLDEFMSKLSLDLKNNFNYDLSYEKKTGFTKIPKLTFNKIDKSVFIAIIIFTLISTFSGMFSREFGTVLGGLLIFGGYYFGKKYIYKNKS